MKKQIMSIAAIAAIFTTGAMAFDMDSTGKIIADITKSTKIPATYTSGVNAGADLALSTNRQGNALIYPAFRSDDGWSTEISLRNTKDVAIIAKAVLYAQNDSRELLDFNLYLSPHDAAKFTISDNKVISSDGSIAYQVTEPTLGVTFDDVKFANETDKFKASFSSKSPAGYVVIYAMMQQKTAAATVTSTEYKIYHKKHKRIFTDYRKTLDVCRDATGAANWRTSFNLSPLAAHVSNGTSVSKTAVLFAPNQLNTCASGTVGFTGNESRHATFTSPSSDALFGEVSISHKGDKRSLLLPATALSNYVENDKVMLWAEGEYASIQDRRINGNIYDTAGIKDDAKTFLVKQTFFTFDKTTNDKNEATLLLTQPMKRALQMAGKGSTYWRAPVITNSNKWGDFKLTRTPWTDDEGTLVPTAISTLFGSLNSPLDGAPAPVVPGGYHAELTALNYATLTEGFEDVFKSGTLAGYIDLKVNNGAAALPAIVTEMSSTNIDGEAQINWIYSATN